MLIARFRRLLPHSPLARIVLGILLALWVARGVPVFEVHTHADAGHDHAHLHSDAAPDDDAQPAPLHVHDHSAPASLNLQRAQTALPVGPPVRWQLPFPAVRPAFAATPPPQRPPIA